MRVRSSGSLMSTRPGRGVVTSARRDEGCDRRPLAAEARRQRARGLARGEVTDLHAVDGAVGVGFHHARVVEADANGPVYRVQVGDLPTRDRKSTRLNSSHSQISYAVFCLKKNKY